MRHGSGALREQRSILDHRLHVMDMLITLDRLLDDDEQAPQRFPALFYEFVDFLLHLDVQHGFDNSVATLGGLIRHAIPSFSISNGVAIIRCRRIRSTTAPRPRLSYRNARSWWSAGKSGEGGPGAR